MKKLLPILLFCVLFTTTAAAQDKSEILYQEQFEGSGAGELENSLPDETKEFLFEMGMDPENPESLTDIGIGTFFTKLWETAKEQMAAPFKAMLALFGVILLVALTEGIGETGLQKPVQGATGYAATLAAAVIVILPLCSTIFKTAQAVKLSAGFMLALVPVLAGILVAAGRVGSSAAFSASLYGVSQIVSQTLAGLVTPFVGMYLALCAAGGVSGGLKLRGVTDTIKKAVVWTLGISMTVFVGVLTLQSTIGAAGDSVGIRTAKFFAGSFVPVVGSALGDALGSVQSCLGLLQSSVGVYAVIALAVLFLPVLLEILLWMLALHLCCAAGELFALDQVTAMLRSIASALSIMLAVVLSCGCLFIISTAIVVKAGGSV